MDAWGKEHGVNINMNMSMSMSMSMSININMDTCHHIACIHAQVATNG